MEVEAKVPQARTVHYVDLDGSCVAARVQHDEGHKLEPCLLIFFEGETPRHRHHVKHSTIVGIFGTWHEPTAHRKASD